MRRRDAAVGDLRVTIGAADPAWDRSLGSRHDTITTDVLLAHPRSRHNAREARTSQAECPGFESRLPLHFTHSDRTATPNLSVAISRAASSRHHKCAPFARQSNRSTR